MAQIVDLDMGLLKNGFFSKSEPKGSKIGNFP
jgi:hypothetical protein